MTAKELATLLDGNEYLNEITQEQERKAKENDLVVVFGLSDDSIELVGAIDEEFNCYDGYVFFVYDDGSADCSLDATRTSRSIEAVWCEIGMGWYYKTDIPHETFNIYYGDELFCTGIVFDLKEAFTGYKEKHKENVWHKANEKPEKEGLYLVASKNDPNTMSVMHYGEYFCFGKNVGWNDEDPEFGSIPADNYVGWWTEIPEPPRKE